MAGADTHLKRLIAANGPITLAQFMTEALMHRETGYYATAEPFGPDGDFITAPELSQMFGELLGLWAADYWQRAGRPAPFRLVELGPGRGIMMSDALRAARAVPAFLEAADLHLVETSPQLKGVQAKTFAAAPLSPQWHERLMDVPEGPMILLANEFFDCLPIQQHEYRNGGWGERRIGLNDSDEFVFVLAPGTPPAHVLPDTPPEDGAIREVSPPALSLMGEIGGRIRETGGAALVIDYGYDRPGYGDTFQAVKAHAYADPLTDVGATDLTAHVDFALLARAAAETGVSVHGPIPQGDFLKTLGIETRAAALMKNADPEQRRRIETATRRLVESDQMGTLFKCLAVTSSAEPVPAGFAEAA